MSEKRKLTIEDAFRLAVKNHQENKIDVALNLYSQLLKINPNHSPALNNVGVIYADSNEHQKAKDCYKKAIEINPNYADAHNNLGNIFQKL